MAIIVHKLKKQYGSQTAVNEISFQLKPGVVTGFLGPNGAGKSTTMKMLTGYLKPDGGTIQINGINLHDETLECKKLIGYLSEANPLYYDMYVKEYLSFIGGVHGVENLNKRVLEVIDLVGLTNERNKKAGQLSKGYKQRLGLAAALIHDPAILILDEPTSGLDPNQIIEIRNIIQQQGKTKTVLFSSHILQEVEAICQHIIILHQGNIIANTSIGELKQNQSLENVFRNLTQSNQ